MRTEITTVIYHRADFDGIFCKEIARKWLGDNVNYIGWNHGDAKVPRPDGEVYILDLNPDCLDYTNKDLANVIWIDHHKSAIDKYQDLGCRKYVIDGVAACRLAWQWFSGRFPDKEAYINRKVKEPLAVRLAGEYDVWDKRDPYADPFQYGLRVYEPDFARLLSETSTQYTLDLVTSGAQVQSYTNKVNAGLCKYNTWVMEFEGLKFLCANTAGGNSLFFAERDKPETGHDALMKFNWQEKGWCFSLYHSAHRKDLDLSVIALKYGGGGHRGACGFACAELPFKLERKE